MAEHTTPGPVTLKFWGRDWTLIETDAPTDYDYMPAITVYDAGERRFTLLSGTPKYCDEYQFPRYRSGLYSAAFSTEYTVEQIEEALFRLVKMGKLTEVEPV